MRSEEKAITQSDEKGNFLPPEDESQSPSFRLSRRSDVFLATCQLRGDPKITRANTQNHRRSIRSSSGGGRRSKLVREVAIAPSETRESGIGVAAIIFYRRALNAGCVEGNGRYYSVKKRINSFGRGLQKLFVSSDSTVLS